MYVYTSTDRGSLPWHLPEDAKDGVMQLTANEAILIVGDDNRRVTKKFRPLEEATGVKVLASATFTDVETRVTRTEALLEMAAESSFRVVRGGAAPPEFFVMWSGRFCRTTVPYKFRQK